MSYRRAREEKRRLKRLYRKVGGHYGAGIWYDPRKNRYVRYWLGARSGLRQYLKRLSNRAVRRYDEPLQYGKYRKAYDYWWELY